MARLSDGAERSIDRGPETSASLATCPGHAQPSTSYAGNEHPAIAWRNELLPTLFDAQRHALAVDVADLPRHTSLARIPAP